MHQDRSDPIAELPPLRVIINDFALTARKSLGQHFLLDLNLTRRITRLAGDLREATVIEVGPGPGGLTRALLLQGAQHVIAIEKDRRCQEALQSLVNAADGRLTVIAADALTIDPGTLGPAPRLIVSNLPYNIGTPLLVGWLRLLAEEPRTIKRFVLMFQREVAERLVAQPRSKSYGRLTVLTQWLCYATITLNVPAAAFTPPPKVDSAVVTLEPRPAPLAPCRLRALERVTASGFGQRRKMLRQALRSLNVDPARLLQEAGIAETRRAEELTVEEFCALARGLERIEAAD